jgi:DnaJ domain
MDDAANTQRRSALRKPGDSSVIHVEIKDDAGNARWVTANLVDVFGNGCGLALMTSLRSGSTVVVRGKLGANRSADHLKAGVRWCRAKADGTVRAGLEFLDGGSRPELNQENTNSVGAVALDCYEVLQLSPNADRDAISRAYRTLAFRYHPDNTETGNSEKFIRLSEAYQILSDPIKHADYDLRAWQRRERNSSRSTGGEWEKRASEYLGIVPLLGTVCWEG